MSDIALPPPENRLPALALAAALHLGLLAFLIFVPTRPPPLLPVGSSVPINIVSQAPATNSRPAVQAPQTVTAQAPAPQPQAKPTPPAPVVAPPQFTPSAAPTPKPQKPVPQQPSQHAAAAAAPAFDFNHMQQIIDSHRQNTGAAASSAQRGPARAETAPQARPDAGQNLSQSDLQGLQQLLERLWNPNCDVLGGNAVKLQVKFVVTLSGHLLGDPSAGGAERSSNPVVAAAARRALDAVRQAEPYAEPYYGQSIVVNFDAKEACSKR